MPQKRFLESELRLEVPNTKDTAFFHIIPVPLEATVSYGHGTALGPEAILQASDQLELLDGKVNPSQLGIFTWDAIDCTLDSKTSAKMVLEQIKKVVSDVIERKACPVVLGGEHTVTFGALAAIKEKYGTFGIIQIDAHADLRNSYDNTQWSHACVMRRAVNNLELPLVQFGVRTLCQEEVQARQAYGVAFYDAEELAKIHPLSALKDKRILPESFPQKVYITFDVDGLDPSIMPATGTPVPGGLGWYESLELLRLSLQDRTVLGFDVVEFAPIEKLHFADFTAARLVYALMGLVALS